MYSSLGVETNRAIIHTTGGRGGSFFFKKKQVRVIYFQYIEANQLRETTLGGNSLVLSVSTRISGVPGERKQHTYPEEYDP